MDQTGNRVKFLIVEDDVDQRQLMRETLEDHFGKGTVIAVADRESALGHDLASFSLILADQNLPDGSGLDLLSEIRSRCSTPVIMVTGENVVQLAAEAVNRGATDYVVKFPDYLPTIPLVVEKNLLLARMTQENERLSRQLERTAAELQFKNGQLQESLERMEQMAATDPLTGLYNRRHFGLVMDQLFAESQRFSTDLSCVMVDLDGYKQCNDTFGHQVGDQLLSCCGKVITANLRRMDVAARYGGDEFVLLLPRADTSESAGVVQRIRDEYFAASSAILGRPEGVQMSVGIAGVLASRPSGTGQLLAAADQALYRAKGAGRNRIAIAEPATTPVAAA